MKEDAAYARTAEAEVVEASDAVEAEDSKAGESNDLPAIIIACHDLGGWHRPNGPRKVRGRNPRYYEV